MNKQHPLNIRMIDHIVIRTNALQEMVAFYRDVLNCPIERQPDGLGLIQMRAGQSLIDLVDINGPLGGKEHELPERAASNMDHFCIQIDPWDLNSITSHLNECGIKFDDVATRYGALGTGPSIYIKDPEGNTVELKGRPTDK